MSEIQKQQVAKLIENREIARMGGGEKAIEKQHEENYRKMRQSLQSGEIFSADDPNTVWICLNCGYEVKGKEPPAYCPTCAHPKGYFEKKKG